MYVLPAIDIIDGKCVRLQRGDYATAQKVADDPISTAMAFKDIGATWMHVVDLDGAKVGKTINADIILEAKRQSGLIVEVGGGIRDMASIDFYINSGIDRVILGSAALKNQQLVIDAVNNYGADKIAVGIDAKNGMVCAEGWLDESEVNYIELAKKMEQIGIKRIIFTDISKDGMLSGPNLNQLDELKASVSCGIIASGGISTLVDIINLAKLDIYGAIVGKAVYTGDLDLGAAIEIGHRA